MTETEAVQGELVSVVHPFAPIFESFATGEDIAVHILGGMEVRGVFIGFDGSVLHIRSGRVNYYVNPDSIAAVEDPS